MRLKRLTFAVIGVALFGAAFYAWEVRATPLPDNALANVQCVHVEDSWSGYSSFSPVVIGGSFTPQNGAWKGTVLLSCRKEAKVRGIWQPVLRQKNLISTVPDAVMQKVFRVLQQTPLKKGKYKPVITHTDDYPRPILSFAMPTRSIAFSSDSNTPHYVPWGVFAEGGEYVTQSDAPYRALLLLRPYLHEEQLKILETSADKSR